MSKCGVYILRSYYCPGRCYVGSSFDITARVTRHFRDLSKGCHHSVKFQRHVAKYSPSDIYLFKTIECLPSLRFALEQQYITEFQPYFNSSQVVKPSISHSYKHYMRFNFRQL